AAAHYHPAVAEADAAAVPLLVVTADRPLELQHAAASQTIDQIKLFGDHARRYVELGVPDDAMLAHLSRVIAGAVLATLAPDAGAVHVNARFRKPLEPVDAPSRAASFTPRCAPKLFLPRDEPTEEAVRDLADRVRSATSVLVVAGPLSPPPGEPTATRREALRRSVAAFARAGHAGVAAEVTSGALGRGTDDAALGSVDLLLRSAEAPDLVIEIGRPPVAGCYQKFVGSLRGSRVLVGSRGLTDPFGGADTLYGGDAALVLARVAERLERLGGGAHAASRTAYRDRLRELGRRIDRAIAHELEGADLTEPALARDLMSRLPDGSVLLVGNSTPVRDACTYGSAGLHDVTVMHQRGAAGIDGLFAGAVGARLAARAASPVAALIGDVSAQHDIGSLAVLARVPGPLVCVVADNGGGRIFEDLPLASTPAGRAHLTERFLTPPVPGFLGHAAAAFGVDHARVTTRVELAATIERGLASKAPLVIEVATPIEASRAARARILRAIAEGQGGV
ncbi:MAG: 2-succinyl-5-enolpyruvyl-6-hydroxy-3-cyclohexene-1-carboxylate synthase, partial [Polyangiaceae bacterium]|nr:2-succinyl-5-enolpyruvyl-6-hydroxy-3-cyclohexene-1-carboxylate synthase [Polyangiaceae bacterium]